MTLRLSHQNIQKLQNLMKVPINQIQINKSTVHLRAYYPQYEIDETYSLSKRKLLRLLRKP